MQYEDDIELQSPIEDAWAIAQPEPTNLIAAWPHSQMPSLQQVVAALQAFLNVPVRVLDELDTDAPEIQWTAALQVADIPGITMPLLLWAEPARAGADHPPAAAGCRWVLGAETLLDRDDPLTTYHAMMRMLAGAFAVPAILDINTLLWRDRNELHQQYLDPSANGVEPPAEHLWSIHAVQQQQGSTDQPLTWLHTHGLWRCGLPELEMLEVPAADASAAALLLNDIAELLLEQRPSQPGEHYEIGADLAVTFQPWEAVAAYLAEGVPGAMADRTGEENQAHAGVRAVVCAEQPAGTYRKLWRWPEQVIRRLQGGDAALYMTQRASKRQAALARKHWPVLQQAFAAMRAGRAEATFLVKAAFELPVDEQPHREHLWVQLDQLDQSGAEGTLVNQPIGDLSLARGDRVQVAAAQISDWQVQLSNGTFGPDAAAALLQAVNG